jgi:hypothetical protein
MAKNFEKLIFEGLHEKHAVQRGIWVPSQHLLWDQGKPRKTLIELADNPCTKFSAKKSDKRTLQRNLKWEIHCGLLVSKGQGWIYTCGRNHMDALQ